LIRLFAGYVKKLESSLQCKIIEGAISADLRFRLCAEILKLHLESKKMGGILDISFLDISDIEKNLKYLKNPPQYVCDILGQLLLAKIQINWTDMSPLQKPLKDWFDGVNMNDIKEAHTIAFVLSFYK